MYGYDTAMVLKSRVTRIKYGNSCFGYNECGPRADIMTFLNSICNWRCDVSELYSDLLQLLSDGAL